MTGEVDKFVSGLGSGFGDAAKSTWEGVKSTAQTGWDIARDAPGARDDFWTTTKATAQAVGAYGAKAYDNPATVWRDARDAAGSAWTQAKDFSANAGPEDWGKLAGGGAFTVGSSVVGVGLAGKAAQLASRGGKLAQKAKGLVKGDDKKPGPPPGPVVPCAKAIAETKARLKLREDLGPEHFKPNGEVDWPNDNGFAVPATQSTLKPGTVIDRYSEFAGSNDGGFYFSPEGTSYKARSLPYDQAKVGYARYRILKPLDTLEGHAAPAFDQIGGGTQYKTPKSTRDLIREGFIEQVLP
jgi:Tuberculosis necrotizing toxin